MNNKLIKKNLRNESRYWWIRSACSYDFECIGYVGDDGLVGGNYDSYEYFGVSSPCLTI